MFRLASRWCGLNRQKLIRVMITSHAMPTSARCWRYSGLSGIVSLRVKDDLLFDGMRVDLETAIRNKLDEARLALNAKYGPEPTAIVEDKAAA